MEVMAGPEGINLTQSQKRVLRKTAESGNPQMAAERVAAAEDSRNLVTATKTLARYGYVTTVPFILGPDTEARAIELTDKGHQAIDDHDIMNDESLVTQDEKEESEPEGQPATAEEPTEAGAAEDELGGELGGEEGGVELELSSFFHEVNDLANLKS